MTDGRDAHSYIKGVIEILYRHGVKLRINIPASVHYTKDRDHRSCIIGDVQNNIIVHGQHPHATAAPRFAAIGGKLSRHRIQQADLCLQPVKLPCGIARRFEVKGDILVNPTKVNICLSRDFYCIGHNP
ncbi:MAG: hypothetical protein Q4F74_02660 [Synergistaceae bacterium]|nr:hypothetical protein [Synergistaceae bacterium]